MKSFCTQWRNEHADDLFLQLGEAQDHLEFLHGFFFAPSVSINAVPHLQNVFQADAAHCAWGKYTLYSLYGTSANGNMFPVTLGVIFGNENKESWLKFWKFAVEVHPSLNRPQVTIITDQCKGSIAAIKEYAPNAYNFHCSYHRLKNVLLKCRGGDGKNSPHWVFRKLLACNNMAALDYQKERQKDCLVDAVWGYFNKLPEAAQFPAARCAMGADIFLHDHEASSGVESMNNANKKVRHMAAVDPNVSVLTLLRLEAGRFEKQKSAAWEWNTSLTPRGEALCHEAFAVLVKGKYTYDVVETHHNHETKVRLSAAGPAGGYRTHTVITPKEEVEGSRFGSCTCGIPQTKTIPCEHMVAVVQANIIPGLTQLKIMPVWCTTAVWRRQYPRDQTIRADLTMQQLVEISQPNHRLRVVPKTAAPNKSGAKKKGKRVPGPCEKRKKKKQRIGHVMDVDEGLPEADDSVEDGDGNGMMGSV
jgi:hypothetical protein